MNEANQENVVSQANLENLAPKVTQARLEKGVSVDPQVWMDNLEREDFQVNQGSQVLVEKLVKSAHRGQPEQESLALQASLGSLE